MEIQLQVTGALYFALFLCSEQHLEPGDLLAKKAGMKIVSITAFELPRKIT